MTRLQRVFNAFHGLVSKLDQNDEVEVRSDEVADPYVVDIVNRLDRLRAHIARKNREVV
ncbi:hypothetical protein GR138_12860 [Shinella kummerowiae]|uniref:Uncharacterized protein n=1 Tax=Shinella kummerowiae TaxID=417745 RepID=A0A6N8SBM4_9HYPH|nr:hypothetical protein [Shinella kummerowiae]MXN46081.1 hypothetical protein [Shinella kummerowiae]